MKWRVPDKEVHQRGPEESVCKDYEACKLNRDDAMDSYRWRKLIKDG